jgi:hypothetical protein
MAYNVLKGAVEGSVDQHADQEINGVKVFKNTVSASAFYDTDDGLPCITEKNVAVTSLSNITKNGLMVYRGDKAASTHYNLTFDGNILRAHSAHIDSLTGNGAGLKGVPADQLSGKLPASFIELGPALISHRDYLKIKVSDGVKTSDAGLSVALSANSGLDFKNGNLTINPLGCPNVQVAGQNIDDRDLILLYDISEKQLKHTTFKNIYDGFLNTRVPNAEGTKNCVQFRGQRSFQGNEAFTFDPENSTLAITGRTKSDVVEVSSKLEINGRVDINGALYKNIVSVDSREYFFKKSDNTVLFDTSENAITAILPPASESRGRVLTIKKVALAENKFKLKGSHRLIIAGDNDLIDFSKEVAITSNYSSRVLHSDGNKWWIINRCGT